MLVKKNREYQDRIAEKYRKIVEKYRSLGFSVVRIGYIESFEKETFLVRHRTNECYWITPEGRIYIAPPGWQENQPKEGVE